MNATLAQIEAFDEFLDEVWGDVELCGQMRSTSVVLKRVDPVQYEQQFAEWLGDKND